MGCDLAIVGGGVLGVAHAIAALRRGLRVELVDRTVAARGASVRNFGMIWPIGQPRGTLRDLAGRSAALWQEMAAAADFRCERVGSLHVARHDDEEAVLREYAAAATPAEAVELWSPEECAARAPGVVVDGLRGGLFSATERSVDPPAALRALRAWLQREGCVIHAPDVAVAAEPGLLRTAAGRRVEAERIAVCSGIDFETLAPEAFREGWTRCRLQMMATAPQPADFVLGPMRAAGLTLLHYASFQDCPSLAALRARLDAELPAHRAHGVHVMVAQHSGGELILGDSHEYGLEFEPYAHESVDRLITSYLAGFFRAPTTQIARRWTGVYAVRRTGEGFTVPLADGVVAVNGVGGAGMTLSLGLGEAHVMEWFGPA
jgi:FAD dependent oxidoreductase TIGR03364